MAFINHLTREINVKIAWLDGQGESAVGHARAVYEQLSPELRGEWHVAQLPRGEVVFFDFMPKGLGDIRGYLLRLHIYASTLHAHDDLALFLRGADAVIAPPGSEDWVAQLGRAGVPMIGDDGAEPSIALVKAATKGILLALRDGSGRLEDAPAPAPPPEESRWVDAGPYRFLVPNFCGDVRVADAPPFHRLDGVHVNQVSLSFAAVLGQGSPSEVERALTELARAWGGSDLTRAQLYVEGVTFTGFRVVRPPDPVMRAVDCLAAAFGPDLLLLTIIYGGDGSSDAAATRLFQTMIAGALIRRMDQEPAAFAPR